MGKGSVRRGRRRRRREGGRQGGRENIDKERVCVCVYVCV